MGEAVRGRIVFIREGRNEEKMGRMERRFWDFIIRHRLKIFVIVSTFLSALVRYELRNIVSGDMQNCFLPWYEEIRSEGGLSALAAQVGDYSIPFQTLVALLTYLPLLPIHAYKGLSILFDYALGIVVAAGVYELTKNKTKASVAYAFTVVLPAVILNSAAWGQFDSIFTFFLVACFVFLIKEKYIPAFLLYGCSMAFKLQAIFFLPFLLFYYVWSKKISIWHFLLSLLPMIAFSLGAMIQGRGVSSLLSIYLNQVTFNHPRISWNYPSFWLLLVKNIPSDGSDHFYEVYMMCLTVTVVILGAIMLALIHRKEMKAQALLLTAIWMMYTCVLFLPSMHDRYAYPVVIFTLLASFAEPGLIPVALGHLILETEMYGSGLLFKEPLPWQVMSLINIACYVGAGYCAMRAAWGIDAFRRGRSDIPSVARGVEGKSNIDFSGEKIGEDDQRNTKKRA